MDCKETNKLFTAYLDNEITESERKSILAHLASCPACRKEVDVLSATQAKFRQALKMVTEDTAPSAQAWAKLREQILSEKEAAVARVLPARETWWERMGRVSLIPRRLTWKTAVAGMLAVVIITSVAIAIPTLTGNSEKVSAAEISLKSPEVQSAFGKEGAAGATVVDVVRNFHNMFVVLERDRSLMVVAQVDPNSKEVVQTWVWNITEEEKQKVKDIAESSSDVQNLIAQGAVFRGFTPYYSIYFGIDSDGKPYVITFDFAATVIMDQGGKTHYISVSLNEEKVTNIFTSNTLRSWYLLKYVLYAVMAALIIVNILVLVGIKRKNVWAVNHAVSVALISGMVSVCGFLFGFARLTTAFWLLGMPLPIISLTVNIVWLQHGMITKKHKYDAMILSSLAVILGVMLILSQVTSWSGSSTIPF